MPWSASDASSRAAQQRMSQQHANQFQRFRRQGQQRAARQMNDMMEKSRASRKQRRQDAAIISPVNRGGATDDLPHANGRRPRTTMPMVLAVALAAFTFFVACAVTVAVVTGSWAPSSSRTRTTVISPPTTNATGPTIAGVVVTEAWNVRSGPSVQSPSVGTVDPGDTVSVLCVTDGWAKLATPFHGNFIYIDGITLTGVPPRC